MASWDEQIVAYEKQIEELEQELAATYHYSKFAVLFFSAVAFVVGVLVGAIF